VISSAAKFDEYITLSSRTLSLSSCFVCFLVGGIGGGGDGQNLSCTLLPFPFLLENLAGSWFVILKKHNSECMFLIQPIIKNVLRFSHFLHLDDELFPFLLPRHKVDVTSPFCECPPRAVRNLMTRAKTCFLECLDWCVLHAVTKNRRRRTTPIRVLNRRPSNRQQETPTTPTKTKSTTTTRMMKVSTLGRRTDLSSATIVPTGREHIALSEWI
jgi:hypothetical protein